jgi:hypothetical protein
MAKEWHLGQVRELAGLLVLEKLVFEVLFTSEHLQHLREE